MFLSNLIFRFKIKRKAEREYREGHLTVIDYATHCSRESYHIAVAKYMDDTLKLLHGGLPAKEETPDFIDRLDEELRRK
ncbi:hypothetical protein LCGC14_2310510 [marine sediment metagenome]|uniref:Uncharacterized protein n=1 Tax=marine sediment metagenome TaxID=412755 RepID=A0A0F9CLA2_9ZZZZ